MLTRVVLRRDKAREKYRVRNGYYFPDPPTKVPVEQDEAVH